MIKISMDEAVRIAADPEAKAYMLVRLAPDSTITELSFGEGFYLEELESVKAEPPAKKKKPGPKKIDTGKINALYEGGWSIAKIADEMRCSESTVYNHIKRD